jgi:RNase P/RNase MRP subunit p30
VIYMDNVDMYLVKKVRGTNTNVKMKNELKKAVNKMNDKMQIVVIGCINIAPTKILNKDLDIFPRKIFFPLPKFADLKLLWKH